MNGGFSEDDSAGGDAFIELDIDEDSNPAREGEGGFDFAFDLSEDEPAKEQAAPTRNLQADLEEAEFYLQQGLYEEADRLCGDILSYAPDSKECLQKLEEIAAMRSRAEGADASESDTRSVDDLPADVSEAASPLGGDFGDDEFDFSLDGFSADGETEKKVLKPMSMSRLLLTTWSLTIIWESPIEKWGFLMMPSASLKKLKRSHPAMLTVRL